MLNGFNLIFQEKKRLGSWDDYLAMRDTIISVNNSFKNLLSKDLGAIAGLLFDVGVGTLVVDENAQEVLEDEEKRRAKQRKKRREEIRVELAEESMHTRIQCLLIKIGRALGYDVVVASNDRTKSWEGENFSFMTLPELPALKMSDEVRKTVSLIAMRTLQLDLQIWRGLHGNAEDSEKCCQGFVDGPQLQRFMPQ